MVKNTKINKKIIVCCAIFTLLIGTMFSVYYLNREPKKTAQPVTAQTNETEPLNLAPPTNEDRQRVEDNKKRIIEQQDLSKSQQVNTSGSKKSIKPTITYAQQYGQSVEIGAYVSGIFEDGGKCTATFKLGSSAFSKSVTANKNVSSVDCPVMSANASDFNPKGSWLVEVSYDSPTAFGVSEKRQVEVK